MTAVNGIFMVDPTDITPDGDHNGVVDLRGGSQKSVKSRRSIGVISIFTDPSAAKEMAGDTEVTYEYETTTEERMRRVNSTTSWNAKTSTDESNSVEFVTSMNGAGPNTGESSPVNGDQRAFEGDATSGSNSLSRKATDVKKVGSFQMKSSYSDNSPARTPSSSAKNDDVFRAALENSLARRVKRPEGDSPMSAATTDAGTSFGVRHKDVDTGEESQENGTEENNNVVEASSLSTTHDFEKEMNEALKDMDDVVRGNYTESESNKSLDTEGTPGIYRSRESVVRDVSRSASSVGKDPEVASARSSKRESATSEMSGSYDLSATNGDDVIAAENAMASLKAESASGKSVDDAVTPVIYRSGESINRDVSRGGSTVGRDAEAASASSSKRASTTSNVSVSGSYDINVPSDDNVATPVETRSESGRSDSASANRLSIQDVVQSLMADATAQETGSVKSRDGDVTPVIYRSRENINRDVSRPTSSVRPETEPASGVSSKRASTTSANREPGAYHMNAPSGDNIGRLDLMRTDSNRSSSVGVNRSSAQDIVQSLMTGAHDVGSLKSGDGDVTPVIYRSRENINRDVSRGGSTVGRDAEAANASSSKRASTTSNVSVSGSYDINVPSDDNVATPVETRSESGRSDSASANRLSVQDVVQSLMADATAQETGSVKSRDGDVTPVIYRSRESINRDVSRPTSSVRPETEPASGVSSKRASTTSANREPGAYHMNAPSGDNIGRLDLMRTDSNRSSSVGVNRSSAQDIVQSLITGAHDVGSLKSGDGDVTPVIYRSRENINRDVSRNASSVGKAPELASGTSSRRGSTASVNRQPGSFRMNGGDDRPQSVARTNSNRSSVRSLHRSSGDGVVMDFMTDTRAHAETGSVKSRDGDVTPVIYRSKESVNRDVSRSSMSSVGTEPEAGSGISSKRTSRTSGPGSFRMNAPSGDSIRRLALTRNDSNRSGSGSGSVGVNRSSAQDIVQNLMTDATDQTTYAGSGFAKSVDGDVTPVVYRSRESSIRSLTRPVSSADRGPEPSSGKSSKRSSAMSTNTKTASHDMAAPSGGDDRPRSVVRSDSSVSSTTGANRASAEDIVPNFMTDVKAQASDAGSWSVKSQKGSVTPDVYRSSEDVTHDFNGSASSLRGAPEAGSQISSKRSSITSFNRQPGSFRMNATSGDNVGRIALLRNDSSRSGSVDANRSSGSMRSGGRDVTENTSRSSESINRAENEAGSGRSSKRTSAISVNMEPGLLSMNATSGDSTGRLSVTRSDSNHSGSVSRSSAQNVAHEQSTADTQSSRGSHNGSMTGINIAVTSSTDSTHVASADGNVSATISSAAEWDAHLSQTSEAAKRDGISVNVAALQPQSPASREMTAQALPVATVSPTPKPLKQPGQFRTNIAVAYRDITTGRRGGSEQPTTDTISRSEASADGRSLDGPRSAAKQMALTTESTRALDAQSISGETQSTGASPPAVRRPTTLSLSRTDSRTSDVSGRRTGDTGEAMVVSPTALQDDEFKAKLSSLMGGLTPLSPGSTAASQASSLDRRKRARTEPDAEFTPAEDAAKSYSTVPRDHAAQKPVAWTSPTSPVHEVRDLVREGTVGTLVKDVFKNMQLTGGCMDSSSMQRREKALTSPGMTPTTSAGFRFPIEGIDTPSAEPVSFDPDPPRKEKVEEHADDVKARPVSAEIVRQDMERRGFRPIIDMKMAGEIKKKALDLTSRKPHEAVETQVAEQKQLQDTATDGESDLLRQTRESLHKQVLQVGLNRTSDSTEASEDTGHGVVLRKTQRDSTGDATSARLSGTSQIRPESTAFSIVSAESGRDVTMEETIVTIDATKDQKSSLHQQLLEFHAKKAALSSGSVSEDTTSVREVSHTEQGTHDGDSDSPEPERNIATEDNAVESAPVYGGSGVYAADKRREQTTKDTFASATEKVSLRAAIASSKMPSRSSTTGPEQKHQDTYQEYRAESTDDVDATVVASQERVPDLQTAKEDEPTIHSHSYYIETVLGDRPDDTHDKITEQRYSDQTRAVVTTVQSSEQTTEVNHRSSTGYDLSVRQIEVTASDGHDDGHDSAGVDALLSKLDGVDSDSASTLSDSHSSVTVIERRQTEDNVRRTDFSHTAVRDSTDQAVIDTILASGVLLSNEPPQFSGAYPDGGRHLANDVYTNNDYWASDDSPRETTHTGSERRPYASGLIVRVRDDPRSQSTSYTTGHTPRRWADSQLSTPRRSTGSSSDDESAAWSAVRVRYTRPHTRPQPPPPPQQQQRSRGSCVTTTRTGRDLAPQAVRAQLLKPLTVEVNMDARRPGDLSSSLYTLDTPTARRTHTSERRPAGGYKTVITHRGDGGWRSSQQQREYGDDYNGYYYECEHLPTRQPTAVVVATPDMRDAARTSSSSSTTRYLRVEESHTGRIPVRRHSARGRPTVTQVRLDGPSDFETHSAYSEWKPTSGKYSVHRAMQDRIISTQHPDLRYRDQTSYTLNQSGSLGDLQDIGIDPELRDADKRGDNYHITLNLKSTGTPSRPGSRLSRYVDETQIHDSSFGYVNEPATLYGGDVVDAIPVQYLDGGQAVREERIYAVQHVSPRPQYNGGYSVTRIHADGLSPPPPLVSAGSSSTSSRQFEQHSSHYANGAGPKSNFSMQINQTMTMGYKPTDPQPPTSPSYYVKSVTETQRDRVVMNGTPRRAEDDLEQYLSPVEDYSYAQHTSENIPQVVRGNILIKNSIDTTGAPRVIDVVEADETDEVMVEDNVNPFHGHYFQSRENPMYSSDQDLSRLHRETTTTVYNQQRPARHLTNLFNNNTKTTTTTTTTKKRRGIPRETGHDGFDTEIKVTKGKRSFVSLCVRLMLTFGILR